MSEPDKSTVWLRVVALDELPEGRVKTVSLEQGTKSKAICLTHHNGQYGALEQMRKSWGRSCQPVAVV